MTQYNESYRYDGHCVMRETIDYNLHVCKYNGWVIYVDNYNTYWHSEKHETNDNIMNGSLGKGFVLFCQPRIITSLTSL